MSEQGCKSQGPKAAVAAQRVGRPPPETGRFCRARSREPDTTGSAALHALRPEQARRRPVRAGLSTAAPVEYEAESSRFSQTEQGQFVRIYELFSDGPAQTAPDRDVARPAGLVIDDDIIPASVVWSRESTVHVGARPQERRERHRGEGSTGGVLPGTRSVPLMAAATGSGHQSMRQDAVRSLGHRLTDLTDIECPCFSCPFKYPTIRPIIWKARLPA